MDDFIVTQSGVVYAVNSDGMPVVSDGDLMGMQAAEIVELLFLAKENRERKGEA